MFPQWIKALNFSSLVRASATIAVAMIAIAVNLACGKESSGDAVAINCSVMVGKTPARIHPRISELSCPEIQRVLWCCPTQLAYGQSGRPREREQRCVGFMQKMLGHSSSSAIVVRNISMWKQFRKDKPHAEVPPRLPHQDWWRRARSLTNRCLARQARRRAVRLELSLGKCPGTGHDHPQRTRRALRGSTAADRDGTLRVPTIDCLGGA